MPISQADRDRIEDTQLDPLGDHTEILHPINENAPAPVATTGNEGHPYSLASKEKDYK